ncbi:hypothetical protein yc1106_04216 [Curvularia clavata]|uniref:Uncharacterized protein n=1 Tax=Curvularia clavata TaxID=95742 RepID=A0A9Q9DRS1_CURCL|nr:hypothetical protein yc1106_04216 [Curvularia clavata]
MIPQDVLEKVLSKAQETASHSWEYSTVFEALLEYCNPEYSVFHPNSFPNSQVPKLRVEDADALRYVLPHIRTDSSTLSEGNGSSADPFSLLLPATLLSHSPSLPKETHDTYSTAVSRQLSTFLTQTPRFPNGAISHRSEYPSLWSDAIYMFPPNMAYHAVSTQDISLAKESVRQCILYSAVLCTKSGLWRHIANAPGLSDVKGDKGVWSTANAWAAAGISRVLATLAHSAFAPQMVEEQTKLRGLLQRTLDAVMDVDTHPSHLLRNYLDDDDDDDDDDDIAFPDVAGTALMAAAAFRFALLLPEKANAEPYAAWANAKLQAVAQHIDAETGIAHPVVDSLKESREMPVGEVNPEAQAFVILAWAAWRDWMGLVENDES